MATLSSTAVPAAVPAVYQVNGVVGQTVRRDVGGVTVSAGDVWQMVKVPNGAKILDLVFTFDAGGAGNYTVTIGDGGSTTRYFGTLSTAASSVNRMTLPGGFNYSYSAEDTVDISWTTVTSGTAATGIATMTIFYTNREGPA